MYFFQGFPGENGLKGDHGQRGPPVSNEQYDWMMQVHSMAPSTAYILDLAPTLWLLYTTT